MGRGKAEISRIPNDVSRRTSFVRRRTGLLKKAQELAVLCDAHLGLVVFSDAGQPYGYCSPHTSLPEFNNWSELVQRYETVTSVQLKETDDDDDYDYQQMFMDVTTTKAWLQGTNHDDDHQEMSMEQMCTEIAALRRERDRLEASLRRQTGEDLPSAATKEELDNLEQQVELALGKVRETKDKLLDQLLDESYSKVHILEDQNSFLRRKMTEGGQRLQAAVEASAVAAEDMATAVLPFGGFFPEVEEGLSTSLQLWPQQLPHVQSVGLQPSLRLWTCGEVKVEQQKMID